MQHPRTVRRNKGGEERLAVDVWMAWKDYFVKEEYCEPLFYEYIMLG
jgi:hypothetical protein